MKVLAVISTRSPEFLISWPTPLARPYQVFFCNLMYQKRDSQRLRAGFGIGALLNNFAESPLESQW
jgi:hypothetical protein